jgi:hypothetical protein
MGKIEEDQEDRERISEGSIATRRRCKPSSVRELPRRARQRVRWEACAAHPAMMTPEVFVKETMNDLADVGEKLGADPSSWSTNPP